MALTPNTSVVPPQGYHFVDRSTGTPVRIEGTDFDDVARRVLEHRLANHRPTGNPLAELFEYICTTWPHFCHDSERDVVKPTGNMSDHISTRVVNWLSAFVRFAYNDAGVSQSEAERRAIVCAQCPYNVSYQSGCGSCMDSISRLSFVFRRDRRTASDHLLGGCRITSQHNQSAVWAAKLPETDQTAQSLLPSNCWRKLP